MLPVKPEETISSYEWMKRREKEYISSTVEDVVQRLNGFLSVSSFDSQQSKDFKIGLQETEEFLNIGFTIGLEVQEIYTKAGWEVGVKCRKPTFFERFWLHDPNKILIFLFFKP